jgi:hydrogenase small subunit
MTAPGPGLGATGPASQDQAPIHMSWINAGPRRDRGSVALTAAMRPGIEEIVLDPLPGLPRVTARWLLIGLGPCPKQYAHAFLRWLRDADDGELNPIVLVVEGSIPNENINGDGYWVGSAPTRRPVSRSC